MASILALYVMGMHLQTIWGIAKQMHLSFMPFNPVVSHEESPVFNSAGEEVGLQLEIYTKNGWEFFFCFDTKDRALRFAFWQEFPVGMTLNTGTCENARAKMTRAHINHRFYLDGQRVIVLISHRPFDLSVFVQPHWQPFVYR